MTKLHDRHVKLIREMTDNYNLIEQETQDYYIEFLSKWKDLAKAKIASYRQQCEVLIGEKEKIVRNKDLEIETLNEAVSQHVREKEQIMREYRSEVAMRETEIESMRLRYEDEIQKRDRERNSVRQRHEDEVKRLQEMRQEVERSW